ALRVVAAVEARLWAPLGLRSLAPGEAGYAPRYQGGVSERDGSYHQGTVWPWLLGPFVEAWVRVRGGSNDAKREARGKFLAPDLALRVVAAVEARLWAPLGLRSLAPGEAGYAPRYQGGVSERDGSYHQGTVWPWLLGPFVEAWVRVRGGSNDAKREARGKFLA